MQRILASLVAGLSTVTVLHSEPLKLSNGRLEVALGREHGAIEELFDTQTKHNFVNNGSELTSLWEIEAGPPGHAQAISPSQAKSFRYERNLDNTSEMTLYWDDFRLAAAPEFRVRVTVRLESAQPVSRWQISIGNFGSLPPHKVHFPRLANIPEQENERLAVPIWLGAQTANARKLVAAPDSESHRVEWSYPGVLSLQCLTFYQPGGPGLYLASDDTAACSKSFAFFGDEHENIDCEMVHWATRSVDTSGYWNLPYTVMLGTFQGDWITAAQRYRAWATNQVWAKQSRLARGEVADWVLKTGIWEWNRGVSTNVLPPALALGEQLGLPVNVLWHWWHGCAYDTGFPEYLPPREGAEQFKGALAPAQAAGLHTLVYMNQRLWGTNTQSWRTEGAERFAVKAADGRIHPEVYNTFTKAPCVSMCLGTEFWRNKYAGLAERAVGELGVDGIYMDQACTSLACYDTAHGHPAGAGGYWIKGFQTMAGQIRKRCAAQTPPRTVVLAGEGCGELWLPYLDLMLTLQISKERYAPPDGWDSLPFFQAVYHPYVVTFGNYSSLTLPPYDELWPPQFAPKEPLKLLDKKFSTQFCLEQARAFVWGQQPTIANFFPSQLKQRPEEIAYALRLARLHERAAKYLLHGTFLRPPDLSPPVATLPMSRLSIYAGQNGGLTVFEKRAPLALASAWRAPDGAVGFPLASISEKPLVLPLKLDPSVYPFAAGAKMWRLGETNRVELGQVADGVATFEVKLPPRGACVLEITRE